MKKVFFRILHFNIGYADNLAVFSPIRGRMAITFANPIFIIGRRSSILALIAIRP